MVDWFWDLVFAAPLASFGVVIGIFFGLLVLIPALERQAPERVIVCRVVSGADGLWVRLSYADGSHTWVDRWLQPGGNVCVPSGTVVEKRRWELGYRYDGGPPVISDSHLPAAIAILWGAGGVFASGVALALVRRGR